MQAEESARQCLIMITKTLIICIDFPLLRLFQKMFFHADKTFENQLQMFDLYTAHNNASSSYSHYNHGCATPAHMKFCCCQLL